MTNGPEMGENGQGGHPDAKPDGISLIRRNIGGREIDVIVCRPDCSGLREAIRTQLAVFGTAAIQVTPQQAREAIWKFNRVLHSTGHGRPGKWSPIRNAVRDIMASATAGTEVHPESDPSVFYHVFNDIIGLAKGIENTLQAEAEKERAKGCEEPRGLRERLGLDRYRRLLETARAATAFGLPLRDMSTEEVLVAWQLTRETTEQRVDAKDFQLEIAQLLARL